MSNLITPPCVLRVASDTKANWEATTVAIPEGVLVFETDTHESKVGDGIHLYTELDYVFNAIPSALRDLIDGNTLVYTGEDDVIPTSYFPEDVFNIHTVVQTIEDRDNLDISIIKNSHLVMVVDATGDDSVASGMAFYVAKFSDDINYVWIKVGEQESIDLDLSQYLFKDTVTLDDVSDSATYKRLTPKDLTIAEEALKVDDKYVLMSDDYMHWTMTDIIVDPDLLYRISGFHQDGLVDDTGNSIPRVVNPSTVYISDVYKNNNRSMIHFKSGSMNIGGSISWHSLMKSLFASPGVTEFTVMSYILITDKSVFPSDGLYILDMLFSNASTRFRVDLTNKYGFSFLFGSSDIYRKSTTYTITRNTIHHFCVVGSEGKIRFFLDGVKINEKDQTFPLVTSTSNSLYPGYPETIVGGYSSNFYMQDLRFYKRALYIDNFIPPGREI